MLTYDEYENIARRLVYFIEEKQKQQREGYGVQQAELVEAFLQEVEENIQAEEELYTMARKICSVINRLITKEEVLVSPLALSYPTNPLVLFYYLQIVVQEGKTKEDRYLAMNINIEPDMMQV